MRVLRVRGVDVRLRPSLLVAGGLLVVLFAPRFESVDATPGWLIAVVFVVALYVSVLLHELAHLVAAQAFGRGVSTVTLHLLGGETVMEGQSRRPIQEAVIAGVGPVLSVALGLLARDLAPRTGSEVVGDLLWSIGWLNLLVGVFNLLPGLPLDGGRVLRALIWQVTGNEAAGTRTAAWVGRIAALVIAGGVALLVALDSRLTLVDLLIAVVVATVLWRGAGVALRHADHDAAVNRLEARSLAEPPPAAVDELPRLDADLGGSDLIGAMTATPAAVYLLVEPDGRVAGVLRAAAVDEAYRRLR